MKRSKGFSLIELIIVISIIALLFGILLAAIQRIRASAALSSCLNNARQLNIALHGYHDQYGHFPSGIISADYPTTQPFMTWLTKLLPFVEEEPLWQKCLQAYEVEKNFEKPPHLEILGKKIKSYICSADPISQEPWNFQGQFTVAFTNYLGSSGTNLDTYDGILFPDSKVAISAILDGTSNTIIFGERHVSESRNYGWWYAGWGQTQSGSLDSLMGSRELNYDRRLDNCPIGPYNFTVGKSKNPCDVFHYWSHHSGGAVFAFADGSVKFLRYEQDIILKALATRAGREDVSID